MSEQLAEALRMIVEDAIQFKRCTDADNEAGRCKSKDTFTAEAAVLSSVAYFERVTEPGNRPYGFRINRAWSEVRPGWFAYPPKGGEGIEVMANEEHADGKARIVTLRMNGKDQTFTYPGDRKVIVRKGTLVRAMDEAINTLSQAFPGTSVITDWS